ncbi:TVP38/TMEM64 family protein [Gordonia sp. CPCC 205333]|uniref:TVP38/TMEM64 family protein n=1 Tax=Gordonia sp. CPCC 205333 TaxID=3140790 RepID=UPI003AF4014E
MKPQHERPAGSDAVLATDIRSTVRRRVAVIGAVILLVIIGSYVIPIPSVNWVRDWGDGLGGWFPYLYFTLYAVVTIFPFPRSAFTVMSGILFGSAVGFVGAIIASMVAAVVSFLLVRRIGRDRIQPYLDKPVVRAVEARLSRRGWLAVGSLRLIAACPFALANYCSALSSVRLLPYTVATLICMSPGTAAVVFLGDALAGTRNLWLIALTVSFFALGIFGLVLDSKLPVPANEPKPLSPKVV